MNRRLRNALLGMTMIPLGYMSLFEMAIRHSFLTEKIRTKAHLSDVVEEELARLGSDIPIASRLSRFTGAGVIQDEKLTPHYGERILITVGGLFARESFVKHEVYHAVHHLDDPQQSFFRERLRYFFIEEPRACIYQITGF